MLKGITSFAAFIAILAIALGIVAARPEFLNPLYAQAQAYRLNVETRALAEKNDFQRESYQIELDKQRALAQMEIEQKAQRAQVLSDGLALAAIILPFGMFALLFAGAIYITCLAGKLLRQQPREPQRAEMGRRVPFPTERIGGARSMPR